MQNGIVITEGNNRITPGVDKNNAYISSLSITNSTNSFDIVNVYGLASAAYALDTSILSLPSAVDVINTFLEVKAFKTSGAEYSMLTIGGVVVFTIHAL